MLIAIMYLKAVTTQKILKGIKLLIIILKHKGPPLRESSTPGLERRGVGTLWNKFLITPGWILMARRVELTPLPLLLFRDANEKSVAIFHSGGYWESQKGAVIGDVSHPRQSNSRPPPPSYCSNSHQTFSHTSSPSRQLSNCLYR